MLVAGVDVGGTNIEAGLVAQDHEVLVRRKVPTPTDGPEAVIDAIATIVDDFAQAPVATGVGIPGGIHDGTIVHVPNLEGWNEEVELASRLRDRLGMPVALANDADIGLLGEWVAGAAEGRSHVLGVWVGTGIGGALILDGRPYSGSLGGAGELGHMTVRADGALCPCGRRGCVEAYAGRRSMADTVRAMEDAGRSTALFDIQREEGKRRPTSKVWARAIDEGDEVAIELFDLAIETIGIGVASVVNLLDVEQVVVGGGMAEKLGQALADRIGDAAAPMLLHPNPGLTFDVAALGDDSGVVGAAALARAEVVGG